MMLQDENYIILSKHHTVHKVCSSLWCELTPVWWSNTTELNDFPELCVVLVSAI